MVEAADRAGGDGAGDGCGAEPGVCLRARKYIRKRKHSLGILEQIIAGIPILAVGEEITELYGDLRFELEARGQSIGRNDIWIAAHALSAQLTLVTNNEREFRRVPGLKIENWLA